MTVLAVNGETKVINADFSANYAELNSLISPGDYVVLNGGDDGNILTKDVTVLKKAAVVINGS